MQMRFRQQKEIYIRYIDTESASRTLATTSADNTLTDRGQALIVLLKSAHCRHRGLQNKGLILNII